MRVATIGPGTRINVTPLWFGWGQGKIYFYCRGQKVVNLRRNPTCTVLVDKNERFPELQGAMFQGKAIVLEDAAAERPPNRAWKRCAGRWAPSTPVATAKAPNAEERILGPRPPLALGGVHSHEDRDLGQPQALPPVTVTVTGPATT